jgi:hypothetical protein
LLKVISNFLTRDELTPAHLAGIEKEFNAESETQTLQETHRHAARPRFFDRSFTFGVSELP